MAECHTTLAISPLWKGFPVELTTAQFTRREKMIFKDIARPPRFAVAAWTALVMMALTVSARADVQDFTDSQRPLWFDAVGDLGITTDIGFTEFPDGTLITDQYQPEYGFVFANSNEHTQFCPFCYPIDDWGIDGNLTTTIVFDTPHNWFAADHPDEIRILLYRDDMLFHTSRDSVFGFSGVISDIGFDKVVLLDPSDSNVNMDNIYFGAIPAPGAMM